MLGNTKCVEIAKMVFPMMIALKEEGEECNWGLFKFLHFFIFS